MRCLLLFILFTAAVPPVTSSAAQAGPAQPQMTVVIPTITNEAELREYAGATDVPDLNAEELARVGELYARNFDVQPVSA